MMNNKEYVIAMTLGFLSAPDSELERLFTHFEETGRRNLTELRKGDSVGGIDSQGKEVPFKQWIKELRTGELKNVQVAIPESTAAAAEPILSLYFEKQSILLALKTLANGFTYAMTAKDFVDFIDLQEDPEFFWKSIHEGLSKYDRIPTVHRENIEGFLSTPAGQEQWLSIGLDLITEAQVAGQLSSRKFSVPDNFKPMLQKMEDQDPPQQILYTFSIEEEISGDQIVELVRAQGPGEVIWKSLLQVIIDALNSPSFDEENRKKFISILGEGDIHQLEQRSVEEWIVFLSQLPKGQVNEVAVVVAGALSDVCWQRKSKPIIPTALKDKVGPNETEVRRNKAFLEVIEAGRWVPKIAEQWTLDLFTKMDSEAKPSQNSDHLENLKTNFDLVLQEAEDFTAQAGSPFANAFLEARHFLHKLPPSGGFRDKAEFEKLAEELEAEGFNQIAVESFQAYYYIIGDFVAFNWPPEKLFGLVATSASDVFLFPEWNIQSFDSQYHETFKEVSAKLHKARREYFAAVVVS